jgi:Domain of unknown function (DUF6985)
VAKQSRPLLDRPPFPPLNWDEYFWRGWVTLPVWRGFQNRQGPYAELSSGKPSDGTARLSVATVDDKLAPPTPEQEASYRFLIEHEKAVADTVLQAVFDEYPEMREDCGDGEGEEFDLLCPEITRPEQLKALMGLAFVHVLTVALNGTAYVGFEFGCNWDVDGLGVLTHQDRVVELGATHLSYTAYFAELDARRGGAS